MEKLHDEYIKPLLESSHVKQSSSNFTSTKVEFSLNESEITCIKKYDHMNYPLLENILIIETVFKCSIKEQAKIMSILVSKNLTEILGVFMFNPDTGEITFRSTLNCLPSNYEVAVKFYLEDEYGHLKCKNRFLDLT